MSPSSQVARAAGLATVLLLIVAACSNSSDVTVTETTSTSAAQSDLDPDDNGSTTVVEPDDSATTSSVVAALVTDGAPLTGLPVPASADLDYPALAVKIDNHPISRPQTGLDQADLVFEVRVEGITRFLGIFHSTQPSPVGPVRSSRTSDFDILRGLDTPLYSSSGGNDYVANALRDLPIIKATALSRTEYFRDGSRPAPHNLFTNTPDLFALAPDDAGAPEPWFQYRAEDTPLPDSARPVEGAVTIAYKGGPLVTHTWDPTLAGWARTQDGRPHTNVSGDQLAPENVVIMVADYISSPADSRSPEVVSVGTGQLFVLTNGSVIEGTWSRESAESKPILLDSAGTAIALTPGRTWILYPESRNVRLPTS